MEAASLVCPEAPALERELAAIQARLGTPGEQPEDLERVRIIAHRLCNLLYVAYLVQDYESEGGPADDREIF